MALRIRFGFEAEQAESAESIESELSRAGGFDTGVTVAALWWFWVASRKLEFVGVDG